MSTRREFLKKTAVTGVAAASLHLIQACQKEEGRRTGREGGSDKGSDEYTQRLEAAVAETGVTGASFAYWDGNALHTAVAGLRNSVTGDPVTPDTVMHVGSITKVLNAALLMQLVDEGRIALEDPVSKHLPELRIRDTQALKRITCGMLINHTNGINCDWLPEYGPDRERIVDTIDRCADLEQLHPPGEATSYSNIGTVIAGYLTQKLRGESWYTLVKKRVYEPLGMRYALVDPLEALRFRGSIGDLTDYGSGKMVQTTRPFLSPAFAPAGSTQMTSAAELLTFARTMLNGGVGPNGARILSEAAAKRMMEPTADFVPMLTASTRMGLGWMISPGGLVHHGGGGPGVASQLFAHPASGRAVALLTNCDRGGALKPAILDPLLESWTGIKKPEVKRLSEPVDPKPYVGVYESNMQRAEVFAKDGRLLMRPRAKMNVYDNFNDTDEGPPPMVLYAVGDHGFEEVEEGGKGPSSEVRFVQPDGSGRMGYLATGVRLLKRTA